MINKDTHGNAETLEEYKARLATERDTTRTRPEEPERLGSRVVGVGRCRNPSCPDGRPMIEATDFVVETLAHCNGLLRQKREPLLTLDDVLVCERCKPLLEAAFRARETARAHEVNRLIVEARDYKTSTRRRDEIYSRLEAIGEDPTGLRTSINERLARGNRSV